MNTRTSGQGGAKAEARGRGGALVIAALLAVAVVLGVIGYRSYVSSEVYLGRSAADMAARGASLTAEGCLDAVLAWSGRCEAMKTLCDGSIPRLMESCLGATDRRDYCLGLGTAPADTHFGFSDCKARGGGRSGEKACAIAYRAIAGHCEHALGSASASRAAARGGGAGGRL